MEVQELVKILQTDVDEKTGVVRRMNGFGPWNIGKITQLNPLRVDVWDGSTRRNVGDRFVIENVRVRAINADSTGSVGDFVLLIRIGPLWVGLARLRLA